MSAYSNTLILQIVTGVLIVIRIIDNRISQDGSIKYLIAGDMNSCFEAIIFPDSLYNKKSICISTQFGCKRQCVFCATGYSRYEGNLSCAEMKDTVLLIMKDCKVSHKDIALVALMGMGEPLDNYANTKEFLINGKSQLHIERYALSTIGIPDKIRLLADESVEVDLSISLHFADDEMRHQYMPGTLGYEIDDIHDACLYFYNKNKKNDEKVRINYMLMNGINDDLKFANMLQSKFSKDFFKIVILSYNVIKEYILNLKPSESTVQKWYKFFTKEGYEVVIRKSSGQDICGGCGQLKGQLNRHKLD